MVEQVELILKGRVHGVGLRAAIFKWAQELGIFGYVTNCFDGTVYVLAQGENKKLEQLVRKCYDGSKHAKVTHISENKSKITKMFRSFEIKYNV